jgi:hypothetical protein
MLITKCITLFLKSQLSTYTIYYGYAQSLHQINHYFFMGSLCRIYNVFNHDAALFLILSFPDHLVHQSSP